MNFLLAKSGQQFLGHPSFRLPHKSAHLYDSVHSKVKSLNSHSFLTWHELHCMYSTHIKVLSADASLYPLDFDSAYRSSKRRCMT